MWSPGPVGSVSHVTYVPALGEEASPKYRIKPEVVGWALRDRSGSTMTANSVEQETFAPGIEHHNDGAPEDEIETAFQPDAQNPGIVTVDRMAAEAPRWPVDKSEWIVRSSHAESISRKT